MCLKKFRLSSGAIIRLSHALGVAAISPAHELYPIYPSDTLHGPPTADTIIFASADFIWLPKRNGM
jgi:hypothetical protein